MITFDEARCLQLNPFEGERGSGRDRLLKDKIVTVRKPGPCFLCAKEIQRGSRARVRCEKVDSEVMHWRWCDGCCHAMAISWDDAGKALEALYAERFEHEANLQELAFAEAAVPGREARRHVEENL